MTRHSATFKVLAIAALALSAASAASTDDAPGYARNGKTLTGNFPSTGITIEAGATVTFAGVYAEYSSDGKKAAVACVGDATIILAPNTRNVASNFVTCSSAIYVPPGHTLTIKGEGYLEAVSVKEYCSAIGACSKWLGMNNNNGRCGNIVIAGGKVTAIAGGAHAAAIGAASYKGKCGDITICGTADVTAESTFGAAAIGAAGTGGTCGDITIKDNASVKAFAGGKEDDYYANGAGIGAGNDSPCGNIVIATTGRVEATGAPGTWGGAGIGAGGYSSDTHDSANCGNITISSGTIVANGNGCHKRADRSHGNGIGCTEVSSCGIIRITGGNITATGAANAAGIGANGTNSAIVIEGGTVKAIAGPITGSGPYARSAAAVGSSGVDSHCGDITITGGSCDFEGGADCPGIGRARHGSSCGTVTIGEGVTLVKIMRGQRATDYIAGITKDRKPSAVIIAPSLSQTYSDDKSTLILGHGGGTSSAVSASSADSVSSAGGTLLDHLSFDDAANPLKAEVGKDAVVRRNRAEKVSGMGEVKWEANGGDGAVAIPIGWHIAVPIPDVLTKEPGLPFSVSMKVKFSQFARDTYPSLLNMPADNASPGMLYLVIDSQYANPVICVKQWDKSWGAGEKGKSGFTAEKWENVIAVFDRDKTEVFLNGNKIISCKGKLAGSYADCSKAGGYILLSADPAPSGGTIYWADLKIYAGTEGTGGGTSTQGGGGTSSSGGGTTSQGGSATPTSKVNGGVGCFYPASAHGGMLRQEPVKMPDTKRAPDYLNPDGTPVGSEQKPSAEVQQTLDTFSADDGLSAAEKIPALKAYIETHLDEPGIEKLIDLLEKLAKDANDEETLKWVEEIRKKLAEKNSRPDNQGDSGGTNQVRGGPGVMISRLDFETKDHPLRNLFSSPPVLLRDNKTNVIQNPNSYISVGVSIDDGAISLQKNHHLALPIPEILTKEPGHPYSISMKIWPSKTSGCKPLLNMPADNKTDALVSITPNGQIALKQHGKSSGSAIYGDRGFRFVIQTVLLQFDTNRTRIFLDGKEILSHESPLAGSSADCSKAGGYFLLHGDKDGEDNSVTFFDVAVYDGIVDPKKVFGFNLSEDVPLDVKPGGIKPGSGIVWRHRKNGGKRLDWDLPPDQYRILGEISMLRKWFRPSQASPDGGEQEFLACSQNRFDGYFRIEDWLAGKWKMTCGGYDDYMALAIDGKWIFKHPTSSEKVTLNWQATEGIHRFTVVFGDTWGEWGNCIESGMATPIMLDMNDGENTLSFELFANKYRVAKDNVDYLCRKSKKRPSAEFKETVGKFVSDGGIDGAKKVPALKEYIETHLDEPGIELLIDLLEQIAKEANDAETLKWVEEVRKKLADRKSGGGTVEGPGKQGNTGGNQPTGTNPASPAGEEPPNVNPADNGNPPATPTQTDSGNAPTTNPPVATNPTEGGDGGKKPGTTGGGGDEPQSGGGKKPTKADDDLDDFLDTSLLPEKEVVDEKPPEGAKLKGYYVLRDSKAVHTTELGHSTKEEEAKKAYLGVERKIKTGKGFLACAEKFREGWIKGRIEWTPPPNRIYVYELDEKLIACPSDWHYKCATKKHFVIHKYTSGSCYYRGYSSMIGITCKKKDKNFSLLNINTKEDLERELWTGDIYGIQGTVHKPKFGDVVTSIEKLRAEYGPEDFLEIKNLKYSLYDFGPRHAKRLNGEYYDLVIIVEAALGNGSYDNNFFTSEEVCNSLYVYEFHPSDEVLEEEDKEDKPSNAQPEEEEQGEAVIKFAQENMALPANKDKFVIKSENKKKNKVGLDEYRIPFIVLNMPTNRDCKVTFSLRRMGAAGADGRYLEEDAITNAIPYSVEIVPDPGVKTNFLYEAVVKETGDYELSAGTNEGILMKVTAESGKPGDQDYVKVYETFPIYRIHLGLSLTLQANTIPCYHEMDEKSRYKLDKQDIAGDPEKDPDDKYVIRQEDYTVPMRDGYLMLMLYDEDREDFIRIPAVPKETRVLPTKVANDRYCQTRDAEFDHVALVDSLGIKAISTGKRLQSGSHIIKIAPTKAVLDPPLRLLAELEIDAVYSNRVTGLARTFTASREVLLHSQPLRIIETVEDERKYIKEDEHIKKQLQRIMYKIESTCPDRLFSLHDMIERMIDGYDVRFGFDEGQVKKVMETWVGFIEGTFEGANGVPYKVTLADDLKASYAFMQGLRDNTTFVGRMAMGILTVGISEHVFTTMTVLENMQNEIMTCKDAKEFGFLAAFKIGAEEIGKQVLMELAVQGAVMGAAKAANIDVNATMQMWAGRYRKAMDGLDASAKRNFGIYRAGDKALQSCKNFLGGGTKTAAKAIENVTRSEGDAAKRAEELLKKSRKDMTPSELSAVKQYEEAMENGLKKVRKLQKAQQAMEDAAKNNQPALKAAKDEYRRLADEVWSDKCALKKLQEVRGDYAKRMRAQFNNYRENLLDSVQREALGDIAKEMGVPPDQLYLMNASNGVKTDYLTGKKVPGDRDISFMQKVLSDRSKDLTIDQSIGQRAVARRLWKKMHGGQEPPSIDEAMKFMKSKDVTYVNPNGDATSYVFAHNLDGYEDLPGMVGMTKDGKINKYLLSNDLHNPAINAASIKHKGVEWWGPTAGDKLARAAEWEALAAKYKGSAKAKLLEKAFDLRCQAVGDVCEGIRQITKQTDNIIVARGAKRAIGNPLPSHLQELQALGKRVGQDVSPAEFTKSLKKYNLDLNSWADQVSKYVNAKYVPPPEINVPNFFTPKAINDALDREKKKSGRR